MSSLVRSLAACVPKLIDHADWHGLTIDRAKLRRSLNEGSGDALDALIGALGMIEVVQGRRPEHPGLPPPLDIRVVEGWMLGG